MLFLRLWIGLWSGLWIQAGRCYVAVRGIEFIELLSTNPSRRKKTAFPVPTLPPKMEPLGIMCEGEWGSLSGMYATNEESEFMNQLLGEFSPSSVLDGECLSSLGVLPGQITANAAFKVNDDSFVYSSDPSSSNPCFYSQETSTYSGSDGDRDMTNLLFSSGHGSYYPAEDSNQSFKSEKTPCYYSSVDFGIEKEENASSTTFVCTDLMLQVDEDSTQAKNRTKSESLYHHETKFEIPLLIDDIKERGTSQPVDSKRPLNVQAQKNKRNVKPRRGKKITEIEIVEQESSDCSKDDPSEIKSLDISSMTMEEDSVPSSRNRNSKARANRGSATDPQSLYARKRREKINERLRILQGLVPNGTKVDISTMLDEAVQYVKFLQLQIKLLSSDDMWMYAPLAYNGMDLGLNI